MPAKNLAARVAHWSATHRKKAIIGWLVFVIASLAVGSAIGTQMQTDAEQGVGESKRADMARIDHDLEGRASESVLVQSQRATVRDPAFRAVVRDVASRLEKTKSVRDVQSPLTGGGAVSEDGRSALVEFEIAGDNETADDRVQPSLDATAALQRAHPDFEIAQFGAASADKELSGVYDDDLRKAETLSLPVTLLILVVAFGALVAAGIPIILAISSIAATMGLVAIPSQIFPMSDVMGSVIVLIGMAVGVDYALFYLRREREERRKGASPEQALAIAAATSGRAVLISGLTVMVALSGMLLMGDGTFASIGIGTMMVAAVAVLGSLTVLPALLSKLGDKVDKGRVPFARRLTRRAVAGGGIGGRIVDAVLRRPVVSAVAAGALLVALAVPAFALKTAEPGVGSFPQHLSTVQAYNAIQKAFPGQNWDLDVIVEADNIRSPQMTAAIKELVADTTEKKSFPAEPTVRYAADGKAAEIDVPIAGDGFNAASVGALEKLRGEIVPRTVGAVPDAEVNVTGATAGTEDFNALQHSRGPIVFAFVLGLAFLLLLVTFRSIVIPLTAIVLNLLSVGAAYGVLVLVFQEGIGESVFGFQPSDAITIWLPLFLFVILFGLSMDYHVFILSRIKEARDRGMSTADAVSTGIKGTAGTVTSAAVVMVAVFSIFATLSTIDMKQMGIGLAVAILIDATIVRTILVPAVMKLLGRWNWYLPRSLRWLPEVSHEPASQPARA